MNLSQKIESISRTETTAQLSKLLNDHKTQVKISWFGQRVVSIEGFAGTLTINQVAKKYLNAEPFKQSNNLTLKERLECYNLWDKVEQLYMNSDEALNKCWRIFRFFVLLLEFRPWRRFYAGWELLKTETSDVKEILFLNSLLISLKRYGLMINPQEKHIFL